MPFRAASVQSMFPAIQRVHGRLSSHCWHEFVLRCHPNDKPIHLLVGDTTGLATSFHRFRGSGLERDTFLLAVEAPGAWPRILAFFVIPGKYFEQPRRTGTWKVLTFCTRSTRFWSFPPTGLNWMALLSYSSLWNQGWKVATLFHRYNLSGCLYS